MAMWVVQAHREGRWATWGPQGLDLVIQRSRMGAVPSCTRAGLPVVARRGSEVRGKSDKGDKPRKGEAQRCAGVHEGAQKAARGGVQAMKGPGWQKSGSAWVPRSWKMGKWVWWAHRRYSNHRINDATRLVCGENSSRQWETWMDRHVPMWQCSRARSGCGCSVEYCWRLMGGGGHIEGTPTIG